MHLTAFSPGQSLPLVKVWLVEINLSVGLETPQSSGIRFGRRQGVGVLSQIKKNSKKRYKYEAQRVIRR